MNYASLETYTIHGISSMIRDLSILTDRPEELEAVIRSAPESIPASFFSDMRVAFGSDIEARIGDIVVYRLKTPGAYPDIEVLWGERIPLKIDGEYIGVLCERGSTKLLTAEFRSEIKFEENLELQLVAQAGGIGFATSSSPILEKEYGCGTASDVQVLGALYSENQRKILNTMETFHPNSTVSSLEAMPPGILVLGTATDVGKTTVVCTLLSELSKHHSCAAIKASGSGWYEDSLLHLKSGAFPVLNFTFAGIPTTYYLDEERYLDAMHWLFNLTSDPASIPEKFLPPETRNRALSKPDLMLVEHGGDLIWASVPTFLQDDRLMASMKTIIVCSESALSLIGALDELLRMGIKNSQERQIYASIPLVNPEGFYKRLEEPLQTGVLEGVFDLNKPMLLGEKERRCGYSISYDQILSCTDLAHEITKHTWCT